MPPSCQRPRSGPTQADVGDRPRRRELEEVTVGNRRVAAGTARGTLAVRACAVPYTGRLGQLTPPPACPGTSPRLGAAVVRRAVPGPPRALGV